jgi:hypothetical protein
MVESDLQSSQFDLLDMLTDEDVLGSLRKMKDSNDLMNIAGASPREVTNRIKGFFVNNRRTTEEIAYFKKYLDGNKECMDVVNAVLLVEGCVRTDLKMRDMLDWNAVFTAMEKPSPMLTSSMVYRGLSCMRKINSEGDTVTQKFLRLLWTRVEEAKVTMDDQDICPAIYSLQSTSGNSPVVRQFVQVRRGQGRGMDGEG